MRRPAKPAGKATHSGRARKPTAQLPDPDARITVNEAFQQLLSCCGEGHLAGKQLDEALGLGRGPRGGVRLWCGDAVTDPDWYAGHMRVRVKVAPDGQWTAELEPSGLRPVISALPPWSVSARDIATPTTAAKHAGGLPSFDRVAIITEAAAYILANGVPETAEALYLELSAILGEHCPERAIGMAILAPFHRRMKNALNS